MNKLILLTLSISLLIVTGCGGSDSNFGVFNRDENTVNEPETNDQTESETVSKIDGKYTIIINPAASAGSECGSAKGSYTISNEKQLLGNITNELSSLIISGSRNSDGVVNGSYIFKNGNNYAAFKGKINEKYSFGTWIDIYGCFGDWVATKIKE